MIKEIFLICAVATGNFGFEIVECYDRMNDCWNDYRDSLECTTCYTHYNRTICPSYGVSTYEIKSR